jgi:hypothetical protein
MRKTYVSIVLVLIAAVALIGCERKITNEVDLDFSNASCFTCHGDDTNDFVAAQQQWATSVHASGNATHRGTSSSCRPCHASEGFVEASGGPEYEEGDHLTVISCFTCHQPHTTGGFTPRTVEPVILQDGTVFDYGWGNLCANCHQARRNVNDYVYDGVGLSSHWGPHHSNQADVLAGTGGYEYAAYGNYPDSPHTGATSDKNGCVACHMAPGIGPTTGGHSMRLHNEDNGVENLNGCNIEACHGLTGELDEINRTADADFDGDGEIEGVQDEVRGLIAQLGDVLVADGLMEHDEEEDSYHPISGRTVILADTAGAVYNMMFAQEEGSLCIHNTAYVVALLQSSYNYVTTGNPTGVAPKRINDEIAKAH